MRTYLFCLFTLALASVPSALAQEAALSGTVPVRVVVTVEGKQGVSPPALSQDDVMVWQDKQRMRVTGWTPLAGSRAGMQLWLLIDDSVESTLANQFDDLRKFIAAQPSTTQIGVGYMRNGMVDVVAPLSTDHARAGKALRIPMGVVGGSASPYLSLTDLMKKWPQTQQVREVLMITSGIDLYYGPGPEDPYLLECIDHAQRNGVIVHSLYYSAIGHFGHDMWQINWGQSDLAQISDATGGEAYWQGLLDPVSIAPYLDDLSRRLANQYELTFLAEPGKKSELQKVRVRTEVPHVTLVSAAQVWVPVGQ
jgi:hypothetical protein